MASLIGLGILERIGWNLVRPGRGGFEAMRIALAVGSGRGLGRASRGSDSRISRRHMPARGRRFPRVGRGDCASLPSADASHWM